MLSNKHIYTKKLETLANFYPKFIIPLQNMNLIIFFENSTDNNSGFYQVWSYKTNKPILKEDFAFVSTMHEPQEYDDDNIAYINDLDCTFCILRYKNGGPLLVSQIKLPSQPFGLALSFCIPLNEESQPTYLKSSLSKLIVETINKQKIVIMNEYLGVFESPTGDVCNDIIVSSWTLEKCIGEATIKNQKEPLLMEQLNDQLIMLYRQNFFEEKIEFFLWEFRTVCELEVGILINYNINGCILKGFGWGEGFIKKEETGIKNEYSDQQGRTMELLFCINQNNDKHPELLLISLDTIFKRCVRFLNHKMILENDGSMLLQVMWKFNKELMIQYYSKSYKSCICVYNIERGKKYKLLANQHNSNVVSDFYYSNQPQSIIEYIQNEDKENEEELQFAEIKLDQNIKDINIFQHTLVPVKTCIWHYLSKLSIVDIYGDRLAEEMISLLFPAVQPIKVKQQNLIKTEL